MGGKSKSSSSSNTTNVTGQNAISGDNLGTAISGVNNSTINVESVDHGAVQGALKLGEEIIFSAESMHETNAEYLAKLNGQSMQFANASLEEYSATNSENLQMMAGLAGNQAAQNSENLGAVMELAKFNHDGGQSEQSEMNLYLMMFIAAVLGFVTYKAVR
ncbi:MULTISPECIES: hypothetical protein [Vibrio]|uniref:hypothetical protein n=1 Tax=Vibrio TaxID=662 RepID=UPI0002FFF2F0|nr:hypothetical protein [Vibrio cyclitrophicus]ERM57669.1 Methyl-accepting chemotaxis protein [Vibrio cyclitrophicus FF75]OEE44127.1 chemotaxis protein [Vibrio cyclitrophicus FF75]PMF53386.1 chemotaxis protein [Vibrio cyclitrophicus]TVU63003.1 chemotaxis protein [Vibrio atlanticus]